MVHCADNFQWLWNCGPGNGGDVNELDPPGNNNVVIAGGFDNSKGCWVRMVGAVSQVCRTQLLFRLQCEVDFERMVGKEEQE